MPNILVVDDEVGIRTLLSEILSDEGFSVYTAEDATTARVTLRARNYDLVLLDIWMPDTDGVSLLKEWVATKQIECPVIMMSGHATIETAVEATKFGASAFLEKPIALKLLLSTIQKTLDEWALKEHTQNTTQTTASQQKPENSRPATTKAPTLPIVEISELNMVIDFNLPMREARDAFERAYILNVLAYKGFSVAGLARHAQLERTHLYRKLRTLDLDISKITETRQSIALMKKSKPRIKD